MSPSIWQILIVVVIILVLFGPKRIPGVGKSLGEAIRGFKKGLNDDEIDVTQSNEKINNTSESVKQSEVKDKDKA